MVLTTLLHEIYLLNNHKSYVVVEFDSYDTALAAYSSLEYKKALTLLEGGAERMYAVVEGYE